MNHFKSILYSALAIAVGLICASCKTPDMQSTFVREGQCLYAVVLPASPHPSERVAGDELIEYTKKISGANLKIAAGAEKNAVIIGTLADIKDVPREIKKRLEKAKSNEAFYLKSVDGNIYIVGKKPIGALYGTYAFLEKCLDVRWFYPGAAGEYYLKKDNIVLGNIDDFEEPSFPARNLCLCGTIIDLKDALIWMGRNKMQITPLYHYPDYLLRGTSMADYRFFCTARNAFYDSGGHLMFERAVPSNTFFKSHPEYFTLRDGERKTGDRLQRCISNPEVLKLVAEDAIKWCSQGENFMFYYGAHDRAEAWCQCADCVKMGTFDGKYSTTTLAHRFFLQIEDYVLKRHPEFSSQLVQFPYSDYRKVPDDPAIKYKGLGKSIYCAHQRCYVHDLDDTNCSFNVPINREILEWQKRCPGGIQVYEYTDVAHVDYCPLEYKLAVFLKHLKSIGAAGWTNEEIPLNSYCYTPDAIKTQERWLTLWPMYYVASHLLWNVDADADRLLDDAYDKYYGAAAPVMKQYHALRKKLWDRAPGHSYYGGGTRAAYCLTDHGAEKQLDACLDEAFKLAAKEPQVLERLALDRKYLDLYWKKETEKLEKLFSAEKSIVPACADKTMQVDGVLAEDVWARARPLNNFILIGKNGAPKEKTSVLVAYDKDNLYFAIRAFEENAWAPPKAEASERDGKVWADDSVEIFIAAPGDDSNYYHLAINTKGALYDAKNRDSAWTSQTTLAVRKEKDGYVYEVKVPVKEMNCAAVAPGQTWGLHFMRSCMNLQPPASEEASSVDGVPPHSPNSFRRAVISRNLVKNGNFAILEDYKGDNKSLQGTKFPKDWEFAGAACKIVADQNGNNQVLLTNGTIFMFLGKFAEENSALSVNVTASGSGSVFVKLWTWQNPNKWDERLDQKHPELQKFKASKDMQTLNFKYDFAKGENIILYIYAKGEVLVSAVNAVVVKREDKPKA